MWRTHMKIGNYNAKPIDEIIKNDVTNYNDIKYGGRIVLPQIALEKCTSRTNIPFPLIFKLKLNKEEVCCGVHSFESKPNEVFIPDWIKDSLKIEDYKVPIKIEVWALTKETPKGTSALFQPQSMDFLDFSNPKAILERNLRFFTCLGKDNIITVHHNNKILKVKICKTEPAELILITDCDLSVEFIAPPGYVEPVRHVAKKEESQPTTTENNGKRCDGKPLSVEQKGMPVMKNITPVGTPDFEYKIGSLKLDRRQIVKKKTKETATNSVVTKGPGTKLGHAATPTIGKSKKIVERPARRPVTRSQTKSLRNVPNEQNPAGASSGGNDSSEPMDQD